MRSIRLAITIGFAGLTAMPAVQALPVSYTDLWDLSQGATVLGTTGALTGGWTSDARNMFGGTFGTGPADVTNNAIFKDYQAAGYVHSVTWATPAPVTLAGFNLVAAHDAGNDGYVNRDINYRGFSRFTLYASANSGGPYSIVYDGFTDTDSDGDYGGGPTYPLQNYLELTANFGAPLTAQYFRAEFVQSGPYPRTGAGYSDAQGPRILELDGLAPAQAPEPSALALLGLGLAGLVASRRRKQ